MSDSTLPPTDDQHVERDDTLPPEHPAGADAPVSAGEALSGEGIGTGVTGPVEGRRDEPSRRTEPDETT